ncbi:hypothetical protein BH18ACI5_BH18ACI5_10600 [soil metagenome]
MIRLTAAESRELIEQPESGMGYQLVEGKQFDNEIRPGIAYNGELFFDEHESRRVLRTLSYPQVLREATKSPGMFLSLRVMSRGAAPISLSERKRSCATISDRVDGACCVKPINSSQAC